MEKHVHLLFKISSHIQNMYTLKNILLYYGPKKVNESLTIKNITAYKALCCPIWCPINVNHHKPTLHRMCVLIRKDSSCYTVTQSGKSNKQQQLVFTQNLNVSFITDFSPLSLVFLYVTLTIFLIAGCFGAWGRWVNSDLALLTM